MELTWSFVSFFFILDYYTISFHLFDIQLTAITVIIKRKRCDIDLFLFEAIPFEN